MVCALSTVALHRFYAARARLGLDDAVRVGLRFFLLEDVNRSALGSRTVDAENRVAGRRRSSA